MKSYFNRCHVILFFACEVDCDFPNAVASREILECLFDFREVEYAQWLDGLTLLLPDELDALKE